MGAFIFSALSTFLQNKDNIMIRHDKHPRAGHNTQHLDLKLKYVLAFCKRINEMCPCILAKGPFGLHFSRLVPSHMHRQSSVKT